jgi:hypothetical protein
VIRLRTCQSLDEYWLACASSGADPPTIPLLEGAHPWPIAEAFGSTVLVSPAADSLEVRDVAAPRTPFQVALEWARAVAASADAGRAGGLEVVARAGPGAIAAATLARATGRRLRIAGSGILETVTARQRERPGLPITVVVPMDEAGDDVLVGLTEATLEGLLAERPWRELPRITILTGRDQASLSWVVAKAVLAHLRGSGSPSLFRLSHYAADEEHALLLEARWNGERQPAPARRTLRRDQLLESLSGESTAIAYETHGIDSCAKGGDGLVLCGLHTPTRSHAASAVGVLACARGHACPRGPAQLPLSRLRTDTLMLASCNGLRLADSALDPDFNLGLNFLDGPGGAYVSSVLAGYGGEVGSRCMLAALASGRGLAESTLLVNACLHGAQLDIPSYLAVGLAETASVAPATSSPIPWPSDGRLRMELGPRHLAELLVDAPQLIPMARERRLGLAVRSAETEPVYFFTRFEGKGLQEAGADRLLRIVLFRFPQPLGSLEIEASDSTALRRRARGLLRGVDGWVDLLERAGVADQETVIQLGQAGAAFGRAISRSSSLIDFDGSAQAEVARLSDDLESVARAGRDLLLTELVPRLSESFWLTNLTGGDLQLQSTTRSLCPNCGAIALRRLLRHPLRDGARSVLVCLRCMIVSDLPDQGEIEDVTIAIPRLAAPRTVLEARIRVVRRGHVAPFEVTVHPRVSTRAGHPVACQPEEAGGWLHERSRTFSFRFTLPAKMLPHQHHLKAIVASSTELAFAQRPFFVSVEEAPTGASPPGR